MRAALYYGKGDIRPEDIPEPKATPGKVLVEVEWCGICGSDLHLYQLGQEIFGDLCKHGENLPFALGHEFCGRVRSPPPESGFNDGDAVMMDARIPCRNCIACETGKEYSCPRQGGYGYNHGGGFQERIVVPTSHLHRLPKTVPMEYAALIEPFAIAVHAIRMVVVGERDWQQQNVLVLGGGPVGFALILALQAYKPKRIVVSEPTSARRGHVRDFVQVCLDPRKEDVGSRGRELTAGVGFDVVFDCAGSQAGLAQGLDAIKCEGTLMNLAMYEDPMQIPVLTALFKHVVIKFAMIYTTADYVETIKLFGEGRFKGYERMVTSRIGVDDVVEKGFKQLINHKDDHIKILVTPKVDLLNS